MGSRKKKPKPSSTTASAASQQQHSAKTDARAASRAESIPAARYTWPDILRRAGDPTREETDLFTPRRAAEDLVRAGRQIRSDRIVTDVLRWAGIVLDFWDSASAAQRSIVAGYHPGLLRVLVHKAHELHQLLQRQNEQTSARDATAQHDAALAAETLDRARKLRAQLRAVLRSAARVAPSELSFEQVDAVFGPASDAFSIAASLRQLADLATSVLSRRDSAAARRLTAGGIGPEYLQHVRSVADELDTAGARTSSARIRTDVAQSTLDRLDGECLALMEDLRELFEAAHAIDPAVPRLIPVATRSHLKKDAKSRQDPVPPQPVNPS